jgi:hypothetical protein
MQKDNGVRGHMSGRGMKTKGDNFERELAAYINEQTNLKSFRAPLSGGGNVGMSGGADLLGVPELFIEAKRVERLNFHDAMRQAEGNIVKTHSSDTPIVVNRRNRMKTGDSLCLIRLDAFLVFYKSFLRERGFMNGNEDESLPEVQENT